MYKQIIEQIKNPLKVFSEITNTPEDKIILSITATPIRPEGWKLNEICSEMIAKKVLSRLRILIKTAGYDWDKALLGQAVEKLIVESKEKPIEIIESTKNPRPWDKPFTWGT